MRLKGEDIRRERQQASREGGQDGDAKGPSHRLGSGLDLGLGAAAVVLEQVRLQYL